MPSKIHSFSTTVRNPERIKSFLKVLSKLEGLIFDKKIQSKFQVLLIQERVYIPTKCPNKLLSKFLDPFYRLTFDEASQIANYQNYMGGLDMRGRQSTNPISQLGLGVARQSWGKVKITDFGKAFLSDRPVDYLFLKALLKIQYPNPRDRFNKNSDGFDIIPFLGCLKFIKLVNSLKSKKKGLTKNEFEIFVLTLKRMDDKYLETQLKKLICYRSSSSEQKNNLKIDFAKEFYQKDILSKLDIKNFSEYGDNVRRYYQMTELFRITRPNFLSDWRINFNPLRVSEINQLIENFSNYSKVFKTNDDYIRYMADSSSPALPWENKHELIKVNHDLFKQLKIITELNQKDLQCFETENNSNNNIKDLTNLKHGIIDKLKKLNMKKYTKNMLHNIEEFDNLIKLFGDEESRTITKLDPEYLEKFTSDIFLILGDYCEIRPNYLKDEEYNPIGHAPGGKGDIECFYKQINILVEVTKMRGSQQAIMECEPVARHLNNFSDKNKRNYLIFIAPDIHDDSYVNFYNSCKGLLAYGKQNIIPFSYNQIFSLLRYFRKSVVNKDFKISILESILVDIVSLSNISITFQDWKKGIDNLIKEL